MLGRLIVAAAIAGTTLVAGTSQAARCPLVTDPAGDTASIAGTRTPADSAFPASDVDLTSADAWVAGGKLNVVLRMLTLPNPESGLRLSTLEWTLYLRAPEGEIAIGAQLSPDLEYRAGGFFLETPVGDSETGAGAPREILGVTGGPEGDGRTATIRLQVPLSSLRPFTRAETGTTWTNVTARSTVFHGGSPVPVDADYVTVGSGGGTGYQADIAKSGRRLVIGKPECSSAPPRR